MATKDLPEPALLRKLLRYEPETGKLYWLERTLEMFPHARACISWNARFARKEALTSLDRKGYRRGAIFNKFYAAHRVIWAIVHGEWPPEQIDHINGDKQDNRLGNLRAVSNSENLKNQKRPKNNTSGIIGVYWNKQLVAWHAQIKINGKKKHLGTYQCIGAAAAARASADLKHGFHRNHGRAP